MRAGLIALLFASLALSGCDRLTGAAEQKIRDAEAIGYACRVSAKVPEECMKENETHSPTAILKGWKNADRDINDGTLDPTMGKRTTMSPGAATAASAIEAASGVKPGEKNEKEEKKPASRASAASGSKPEAKAEH